MDFLPQQTVRPRTVAPSGIVIFEQFDAKGVLVSMLPNEAQCQAYGYTYNAQTRSCTAFQTNTRLKTVFDNLETQVLGTKNTFATASINTLVVGETNWVRGNARNNLINGSGNNINNGVSNTNVSGTKAEATTNNSIVLGGNIGSDIQGKRQTTFLMYGVKTTDATALISNLNNDKGTVGANIPAPFFKIPDQAACFFEASIIAVRTGGSNRTGAIGDYASWTETGVVRSLYDAKGQRYVQSINSKLEAFATAGAVTGWSPLATIPVEGFTILCQGVADVIIDWTISVKITQIKMEDETPCPVEECPETWFWVEENCRCQQCEELICQPEYEWDNTKCICVPIKKIKKK